jgi:hypothetical protein
MATKRRNTKKKPCIPAGLLNMNHQHAANQRREQGQGIVDPFAQSLFMLHRLAELEENPEEPRSELREKIEERVEEKTARVREILAKAPKAAKSPDGLIEAARKAATAETIAADDARQLAEAGAFPTLYVRALTGPRLSAMQGAATSRAWDEIAMEYDGAELTKDQKALHGAVVALEAKKAAVRFAVAGYSVPETVGEFFLPPGVLEPSEAYDPATQWRGDLDEKEALRLVEVYLSGEESQAMQYASACVLAASITFSAGDAEIAKVKKSCAWCLSTAQLLHILRAALIPYRQTSVAR